MKIKTVSECKHESNNEHFMNVNYIPRVLFIFLSCNRKYCAVANKANANIFHVECWRNQLYPLIIGFYIVANQTERWEKKQRKHLFGLPAVQPAFDTSAFDMDLNKTNANIININYQLKN